VSDLLALAAELVAIPSLSRKEAPLADLVERRLGACAWLDVERLGDNVVARTSLGRRRRVVVAGTSTPCPPRATSRRASRATCSGAWVPPT